MPFQARETTVCGTFGHPCGTFPGSVRNIFGDTPCFAVKTRSLAPQSNLRFRAAAPWGRRALFQQHQERFLATEPRNKIREPTWRCQLDDTGCLTTWVSGIGSLARPCRPASGSTMCVFSSSDSWEITQPTRENLEGAEGRSLDTRGYRTSERFRIAHANPPDHRLVSGGVCECHVLAEQSRAAS
jgi:hypothetical protein